MKIQLVSVLDASFTAFIAFILSFVILNYYIPRPYSIIISISLSIPFAIIAFNRISKKKNLVFKSKAEKEEIERTMCQLNLSSTTEQYSFFFNAFKKAGFYPEKKNDGLVFPNKNTLVFCRYSFEGVSKADVVKAFNAGLKQNKIFFLSDHLSGEIKEFISRFGDKIIPVNKKEVWLFLRKINFFPTQKFEFKSTRPLSLNLKSAFFGKKKAKKYFIFGLSFLFMSYLVPIKFYYVLFGCIFLTIALICKLVGRED